MGIPAIVGVADQMKAEYEGRQAIVDGSTGQVFVDPDEDTTNYLWRREENNSSISRCWRN